MGGIEDGRSGSAGERLGGTAKALWLGLCEIFTEGREGHEARALRKGRLETAKTPRPGLREIFTEGRKGHEARALGKGKLGTLKPKPL